MLPKSGCQCYLTNNALAISVLTKPAITAKSSGRPPSPCPEGDVLSCLCLLYYVINGHFVVLIDLLFVSIYFVLPCLWSYAIRLLFSECLRSWIRQPYQHAHRLSVPI